MKKIKIKNKNKEFVFGINNVKYLLGDNYSLKHMIFQGLKFTFSKLENSDFAQNSNSEINMYLNDFPIDIRKSTFHIINHFFNIEAELKLKSNSLIKKFFEASIYKIELDENFKTISLLLDDFSDVLNEYVKIDLNFDFQMDLANFDSFQIIKLLEPKLKLEELYCNGYDLTFEQIILLQLNLLIAVAKNVIQKNHYCYLELPYITKSIKSALNKINLTNLFIIVSLYKGEVDSLSDVYWVGKQTIDFSSENDIYNCITLNIAKLQDIEDTKFILKKLIHNEEQSETALLKKIL